MIVINEMFVLEAFSETFPQKSFIPIAALIFVKRPPVLHVVNVILDLLVDGKWHSLTEIAGKTGLTEVKVDIVSSFLAEYDFVKLDKEDRKIRLAVSVVDFLRKIKRIEKSRG